jgi:hypothetical protein
MMPRIHLLLVVLVTALFAVAPPANSQEPIPQDVRDAYDVQVRARLSSAKLEGLDLALAKAAITRLAAVPDPQVLDLLGGDVKRAAGKLSEITISLERSKLTVEKQTKKLKDEQGDDRGAVEQLVRDAEKELATAKELLPRIRELHADLAQGLLDAISKVGLERAADVFDALVAALREDLQSQDQLAEQIRDLDAALRSLRNRLLALEGKELENAERDGAEIAAKLAVSKELAARLDDLRRRRLAVLAEAFPKLDKTRQSKTLAEIRSNSKPDAAPALRGFHVELYAALPTADAFAVAIDVMKRAASAQNNLQKQIAPLREDYDRALRQFQVALKGSGGKTVPVTVAEALDKAQAALRSASKNAFGEGRVIHAAARAIASAIARQGESDRKKSVAEVFKLARGYSDKSVRSAVLASLSSLRDDPVAAGELRTVAAKDPEIPTRLAALEALAAIGDAATVELCIGTLLQDADWRIRAAAISTLVAIPRKEAIPALIQSLGAEVGRLVDDAEFALSMLTGQRFNADSRLWKDWWEKNGASFEVVAADVAARREGGHEATAPQVASGDGGEPEPGDADWREGGAHLSFYGIKTRSNRILFVIDRSGSMLEKMTDSATGRDGGRDRMSVAKAELNAAIAGLEETDVFNIVSYANDVDRWQKAMQKAAPEVRKKAAGWIEKDLQAVGGTNIYDALREAFSLAGIGALDKHYESNVDTIFFLTDGEPTVGEVVEADEILRRVAEFNRLSRIVVHTVGLGKGHNSTFLRRLAEENGGQYVAR